MADTVALKFKPVQLPRMSLTESQAHSLIARHGTALRIRMPGIGVRGEPLSTDIGEPIAGPPRNAVDEGEWSLDVVAGYAEALRSVCTVRRDLEWAGGHLRLTLSPGTITSWLNANLPAAALDELDEPLLATAVETLLEYVFSELDAASTCGRPRVLDLESESVELPHAWTLAALHKASGQSTFALLEADTLGLLLLANLLKRAPAAPNGLNDDEVPVTVYADLGRTALPAAQLFSLNPQDVIFIDDYRVTSDGEIWLVAQGSGLRVRPEQDSFCVTQGWTALMEDLLDNSRATEVDLLLDDDPPKNETGEGFNVDTIPVTLTFSLGERQMTLGDLRHLQPGEVFDLARPLNAGPVLVRANGRLFATGDLVDIDGRVGVTLRGLGEPEA